MTKTTLPAEPDQATGSSPDSDNRGFAALESPIGTPDDHWVPPRFRAIYRKGIAGKSRKAAIRAFCLQCTGWSAGEVQRCTSTSCPLFPYRIKG
jgi:hypothetical protein